MPSFDVALRVVNMFGCVICLVLLARAGARQYTTWNSRTRYYWLALIGWLLLGIEGAVEVLVRHISVGPASIIKTLIIVWTLKALTSNERVESEPIPRRNKGEKHHE